MFLKKAGWWVYPPETFKSNMILLSLNVSLYSTLEMTLHVNFKLQSEKQLPASVFSGPVGVLSL